MSRSKSEPIRPRYNEMRVASLPATVKPATEGEATGACSQRTLRGDCGRRVGKEGLRNLGDPPRANGGGSRTARSSGEAGNDRGAKGLR